MIQRIPVGGRGWGVGSYFPITGEGGQRQRMGTLRTAPPGQYSSVQNSATFPTLLLKSSK